jgi:hypothetical protein
MAHDDEADHPSPRPECVGSREERVVSMTIAPATTWR